MNNNTQVRFWAIIGPPQVGKSTTIGHLTSQLGRGPGGIREVLLRGGGYLTIFGRRMAWQEKGDGPDKVVKLINEQVRRLQSHNPNISISFFNVLMALRFDSENGCPDGHEYLSHFVQHDWLIESLVLLSPDDKHYHYHRFGAPILYIHNSNIDFEISQMVGKVRNHFGWA